MPRPRSLLIGLLVALVAFWAVAPMARAMLLLRDEQHSMANPPLIGGVQSVDASFYTSDSSNPIPISGWFVLKRPTAPTVILLPGWKADRTTMLPYASFLVRAGMNALLLDFRGSGHSGGSFSLGLNEPLDVAAAVSYLDTMGTLTNRHYGALGVSFGAGVAIAAAGNPLTSLPGTPELRAIVADSPWASENPTVDRLDRLPVLGLSIPLLPDAGWAVHLSLGGSLDDSSAGSAAATTTTPPPLPQTSSPSTRRRSPPRRPWSPRGRHRSVAMRAHMRRSPLPTKRRCWGSSGATWWR